MDVTRFAVLTPAGMGAIAVIGLAGHGAWALARRVVRPKSGRDLPEAPVVGRTWYGTFGEAGDEVLLVVFPGEPPQIEIHCHGGRLNVEMICAELAAAEAVRVDGWTLRAAPVADERAWRLLAEAPTPRTAAILLAQAHGAFRAAFDSDDVASAGARLKRLVALAPVGAHLVTPWRVVIAGRPNAGKSTLLNALLGYQRSIVAPTPGTTRDAVRATTSFDGWPIELADTAGLRPALDEVEAEGVARAGRALASADLVIWLYDGRERADVPPEAMARPHLLAANKADLFAEEVVEADVRLSATTGAGVAELMAAVVARLVPVAPLEGEGVPFTLELCEAVTRAAGVRGGANAGERGP